MNGEKITRLELTIDPSTPYQKIRWPQAYIVQTRQAQLDELTRLTDTERALLDGVLVGAIDLTKLGRKARQKLEQYMKSYVQWLTVTATDYKKILDRVRGFLNFPKTDLQAGKMDYDELPEINQPLPVWVQEAEKCPDEELAI